MLASSDPASFDDEALIPEAPRPPVTAGGGGSNGSSSRPRVIVHIDMDCFYVQVERSLDPTLMGVPCAVSYEARARGVKRGMRGGDAAKLCPEIQLVQVPTAYGKAEIYVYRKAGEDVVRVLSSVFENCPVEKASIDEVYIDITEEAQRRMEAEDFVTSTLLLTENTIVSLPGDPSDDAASSSVEAQANWKRNACAAEANEMLVCGAAAAHELRKAIMDELGYTCSAGIAHNKMLAKIASSMNKPNKQALVPGESVVPLLRSLPVDRIPGFGGKFGDSITAEFGGASKIGEITSVPSAFQQLVNKFGPEQAKEIWSAFHGIEAEGVKSRALQAVISAGKQFPGGRMLVGALAWQPNGEVDKWVSNLSSQLFERLTEERDDHRRQARTLGISVNMRAFDDQGAVIDGESKNVSESGQMPPGQLSAQSIAQAAASMLRGVVSQMRRPQQHAKEWGISSLFLRAGGFVTLADEKAAITRFFAASADRSPQKKATRETEQSSVSSDMDTAGTNSNIECAGLALAACGSPRAPSRGGQQVDDPSPRATAMNNAKTAAGPLLQMWNRARPARLPSSPPPEPKAIPEEPTEESNVEMAQDPPAAVSSSSSSGSSSSSNDPYAGIRPEDIDADFLGSLPESMVDEILTSISSRPRPASEQGGGDSNSLSGADGSGAVGRSTKRPAPTSSSSSATEDARKLKKADIKKYFST